MEEQSSTPPATSAFEQRADPTIEQPTDAVIRMAATCVCGSDLWPYRGIEPVDSPAPWATSTSASSRRSAASHRHRPGQFVIGSFFASDNTCENCRAGYQSACLHRQPMGAMGTQSEYTRIPLADGTLVATPGMPAGTWCPACWPRPTCSAPAGTPRAPPRSRPGKTVAVVGDGAVGLLGVLAARELGAERIIAMSRHEPRQKLALEFGATEVVTERGDEGVARIKELTGGIGADCVHGGRRHAGVDAAGPPDHPARRQRRVRRRAARRRAARRRSCSSRAVQLHGGPAPGRRYLPELIERISTGRIEPGKVFDLTCRWPRSPRAIGRWTSAAIKTLLRP